MIPEFNNDGSCYLCDKPEGECTCYQNIGTWYPAAAFDATEDEGVPNEA